MKRRHAVRTSYREKEKGTGVDKNTETDEDRWIYTLQGRVLPALSASRELIDVVLTSSYGLVTKPVTPDVMPLTTLSPPSMSPSMIPPLEALSC